MLLTKLPDIQKVVSDGDDLRADTADAITAVEIAAKRSASGLAAAGKLRDFFIAAANAADRAAGGDGDVTVTA